MPFFVSININAKNVFYYFVARSSIDTSSMHRGIYEKTQKLESSKFVEPQYEIEEISKSKPYFVVPLSDPKPISEGKNIHLECRFVPNSISFLLFSLLNCYCIIKNFVFFLDWNLSVIQQCEVIAFSI